MSKQIAKPNLTDILQELKLDIFNSFNCHRIGKINGFSSSNQTADIELVDKAIIPTSIGNQLIDFPLLTGCPVFVNKGSNGGFTRPITTGEYCLVLFNDRDIENWFNNGGISEPASSRTHNLTDCLVIVGIFSDSSPLSDYNNAATEMTFQTTKISLDSKVGISNTAQSLQDLILQLNTLLQNFIMVDNPATPTITVVPNTATQTTITQLILDFNALLKT